MVIPGSLDPEVGLPLKVEIVKRSDAAQGFAVVPKRWIVKRTITWLNRCRRLDKDWECLNRNALALQANWRGVYVMHRQELS